MKKSTSGSKSATKSSKPIPPLEVDNNSSINISKIQNGYLISESGYTGKGRNQQYYNKQYFSATNPVAGVTGKVKMGKR